MAKHCIECGAELTERYLKNEGMIPFCPVCDTYRFKLFNTAVIMIVRDEKTGKILLIKQYGRPHYILVAGYVNHGENLETTVVREIKEETGLVVSRFVFNRSEYFEKSNSLMCNFTVFVKDGSAISPNEEIDSYSWFTPEEAKANIKEGSLAERFLLEYLKNVKD
ncbi:MAG: NUDIX domain-containing protein [Spirochaetales bacterium]|nr:NUDIX domain-containing protein [Candidatus Physcosoma equi]